LELPIRKNIRLRDYDYSQGGVYFITICTKNKTSILWDINVGTTIGRPPLSRNGQIIDNAINSISAIYPLKGFVSKRIGYSVWQSRYYDHIIRDEKDYLSRWKYIDENPLKWEDDELFEK
jgi:REP element-mobilizing transposase RayT